jgi:hypothetical protein
MFLDPIDSGTWLLSAGQPHMLVTDQWLRPATLGLVRFYRITAGIVPTSQSLYKLEKQSG